MLRWKNRWSLNWWHTTPWGAHAKDELGIIPAHVPQIIGASAAPYPVEGKPSDSSCCQYVDTLGIACASGEPVGS